MSKQDWKQSQYYQEDFLASHSVQPGSEEARRMTVTSGRKCLELYRRSDPVGLLVRMLLESSHWRSTRCYLTWKGSATLAKRLLFRLVPSMPRTGETAAQLWPTVTRNDGVNSSLPISQAKRESLVGVMIRKTLFPTLTARDFKSADKNPRTKRFSAKTELNTVVGGNLNPEWVEWFMGFPVGWTSLQEYRE